MSKNSNKPCVKKLLTWTAEARIQHQAWRAESWQDYEFRDSKQWPYAAAKQLRDKKIKPITVNRIFPIINYILGYYINNQQDIVAKGRTKADNELAQVMSEAIAFVRDQNNGSKKILQAVKDQLITGIGAVKVDLNKDPRKEIVKLTHTPWHNFWWDPYADPTLDVDNCRYAFTATWKDLDELCKFFPKMRQEIQEQFSQLSAGNTTSFLTGIQDEGDIIEEYKSALGATYWTNASRRRVRPVEMWYTVLTDAWFARMPNDYVFELDNYDISEQIQIVQNSVEVVNAPVKKMHVATMLGDLMLQDIASPFAHDEFPFASFIAYLDRFGFPFGIPRTIKEQNMEVNKRRSMALALINNRRVFIEQGAAENINDAYAEANRPDGFIVLKKDKLGRIKIQEMSDMANSQLALLEQSEREIKEISGANDESLGYNTPVQSGDAIERKQTSQAVMIASLMENIRDGLKACGERIMPLVQNRWTAEKTLRVTDRITGVESFITLNEQVQAAVGAPITVRNNIRQAKFDLVVAARPITDTVREKNIELLFSAINKSPPEAVAPLINVALELSDIPDKDALLKQVRAATGVPELGEDLTKEERADIERRQAEANQQRQAEDRLLDQKAKQADIEEKLAKAEKLRADAVAGLKTAETNHQKVKQDGITAGLKLASNINMPGTDAT